MSRMTRFVIITFWRPILLAVLLIGCAPKLSGPLGLSSASAIDRMAQVPASASLLPWVGGIAIIGGIVGLVLTRGGMGIRAIVIGVLLVILNDVMQRFSVAFYMPILIGTGGVSLAYAWKTIRRAIKIRKNGWSHGKS